MSLRLSTKELKQLQAALTILVSPLDFESVSEWRTAARHAIAPLVHAETAVSFLPIPGEVPYQADRQISLALYAEHFHVDDLTISYARAHGSHAFNWQSMRAWYEHPDRAAWLHSEFLNDWVRPQRLCQPCGLIAVRSPDEAPDLLFPQWSGIIGLWFYRDRETEPPVMGDHALGILQLLLPAFEGGVHLVLRCHHQRLQTTHLLDAMGEGAMLLDRQARVIHQNVALRHFLASTYDARAIEAACVRAGRNVLDLAVRGRAKSRPQQIAGPRAQTIPTSRGACQLRTTLLRSETLGTGPMALVVLERSGPQPLSPRELQDQFQLTTREIAVSRLLAEGHKNSQVAQLLGISIHTARRHAERVLSKLGVHSRAAVAGKLVSH